MNHPSRLALGAFLVAVVGALLVLLLRPEERAPGAEGPAVKPAGSEASPGDAAATSSATPGGDDAASDLAATVDRFFEKIPIQPPPTPEQALEKARQGQLGPIDYRLELERALRVPGAAGKTANLLLGMTHDSETLRFQTALALSKRLDPASAQVLLVGLPNASPSVRPQAVFALRGSPDPEVSRTFVDLYATDRDDAVRAQAAFALGERGDRVDPLVLERARQRAREDLAAASDPRVMKAASDVLGVPPLSPEDRAFLEGVLERDSSSERRLSALQALASSGISPQELEPLLRRVAEDPTASDDLKTQVQAVLQALDAPPAPPPSEGD
jgi:hypothetical protein